MSLRLAKLALVAALCFYLGVVIFNNLTDYDSNYDFIRHVLSMDTTFPGNSGRWRAIESVAMHRAFYASIILWEIAACACMVAGAWQMWQARRASAVEFQRAKEWAIVGLTVNLLQWLVAFLTVGGEWFLMWQSTTWNGQQAAGRMFTVVGLVWLMVQSRDEELTAPPPPP